MSRAIDCLSPDQVQIAASSIVQVKGTVIGFRRNNSTKSRAPVRQLYAVLKPVVIAGIAFDHVCVPMTNSIKRFGLGQQVEFTAKSHVYRNHKIGLRPPYKVYKVQNLA